MRGREGSVWGWEGEGLGGREKEWGVVGRGWGREWGPGGGILGKGIGVERGDRNREGGPVYVHCTLQPSWIMRCRLDGGKQSLCPLVISLKNDVVCCKSGWGWRFGLISELDFKEICFDFS